MTQNLPNTPGFNRHISVKFTIAKNGQRRATYYSPLTRRWLPIPVNNADLFVAQGLATEYKPAA
jgi:hypothetical protein